MRGEMLCAMPGSKRHLRFRALRGLRDKARGLLRTDDDARPVALCGCSSIHTLGMRYPIDVAFVARNGRVVDARRGVPPGRVLAAPGAHYVLERPLSDDPWPCKGSWLAIADVAS